MQEIVVGFVFSLDNKKYKEQTRRRPAREAEFQT